jgi:hypothetical protein
VPFSSFLQAFEMTGDWISMQGSLGHYSSGTGARILGLN